MHSIKKLARPLLLGLALAACIGTVPTSVERVDRSPASIPQAYQNLSGEQARIRARQKPSISSAGDRSTLPGYLRSYLQLFQD